MTMRNRTPQNFTFTNLTRTKILILFLATALMLSSLSLSALAADERPGSQEAFDAVFVLDTSYSMNHADPDKMATEVVRMFMDISDASRTRVGFAAYNHKIVSSMPLTPISVASKKDEIKQRISGLHRAGYTDLGLGLLTGSKLLTAPASSGATESDKRKPFLILLSDGETDFGPYQQSRTKDDSSKDSDSAIEMAQKYSYPIYTIGLNHDGTLNPDELKRIAQNTGGAFYTTSSAEDLPEIFNQIFAKEMRSVLMPLAGVTASGQLQEVQVDIPNSSMSEANLILLSAKPLKDAQLFYSSKNIRLFKSNSYSLLKITAPKQGKATLKFKGSPGDLIKISLLGSYSMEAVAKLPDGEPVKGQPAAIEVHLVDTASDEILQEKELYQGVKAELVILNKATSTEEIVAMKNDGQRLFAQHTFTATGQYEWFVRLEGEAFFRNTEIHTQAIANLAPTVQGAQQLNLIKEDGQTELDLNQLFHDGNGDPLSFALQEQTGKAVQSELTGNYLTISPRQTGDSKLVILATDTEGEQATAYLELSIASKYTLLKWLIVGGLALVLIGIGLFLWFRPKPTFAGKLEGYFLSTGSGSDIPVKSWPLTAFSGRTVNLGELFSSLDVNEPLPEAKNIHFTAGKNGTLVVQNKSRCSLVRNRTPLPAGKQETLEYNDKLYITFEDGITELELRYKAIKPSTNIYTRADTPA